MDKIIRLLKRFPSYVGICTIGYYGYNEGSRYYYDKQNDKQIDMKSKYGDCYGVVTGGSYGLGKEYADQLAKRGFNLVLIARGQEALLNVQKEFKEKYPNIDVRTLQFDFSTSNPTDYDTLTSKLNDIDVGILINNVGTFMHGPLHTADPNAIKNTILVNTFPLTFLTKNLIPVMLKREKRSLVMNISSEAGAYVHENFGVYSATKSYASHLSRCLQQFYKGSNIDITLVTPGPTYTPLVQNIDPAFNQTSYGRTYCADPAIAAEKTFAKLGYQSEIYGDSKHEYFHFMHKYFRTISDYLYP